VWRPTNIFVIPAKSAREPLAPAKAGGTRAGIQRQFNDVDASLRWHDGTNKETYLWDGILGPAGLIGDPQAVRLRRTSEHKDG